MDAGVEEYLNKPISRTKLLELVKKQNGLGQNEEENVQQEALFAAIEQKDYKKAYDTAKELVECLFEECDRRERRSKLSMLESSLFYMIPGMDNIQKNYYLQKYEITVKVLTTEYALLLLADSDHKRSISSASCTMKYAHMNKVFQYIEQ